MGGGAPLHAQYTDNTLMFIRPWLWGDFTPGSPAGIPAFEIPNDREKVSKGDIMRSITRNGIAKVLCTKKPSTLQILPIVRV